MAASCLPKPGAAEDGATVEVPSIVRELAVAVVAGALAAASGEGLTDRPAAKLVVDALAAAKLIGVQAGADLAPVLAVLERHGLSPTSPMSPSTTSPRTSMQSSPR